MRNRRVNDKGTFEVVSVAYKSGAGANAIGGS
jgi:hypothetical protein